MDVKEYMSLEAAAAKWHTKAWYLEKACNAGQVPNAAKLDGSWIIPADMERPEMHIPRESPPPRPVQHGSEYKDTIYRATMSGFPDFNVTTKKIGGTTYTVSCNFSPSAKYTLTEKLINLSMREIGNKVPSQIAKRAEEIIAEARREIPTDEQLREYYRSKFEEIGFSDEDMATLMEKIESHIQTRNRALELKR